MKKANKKLKRLAETFLHSADDCLVDDLGQLHLLPDWAKRLVAPRRHTRRHAAKFLLAQLEGLLKNDAFYEKLIIQFNQMNMLDEERHRKGQYLQDA